MTPFLVLILHRTVRARICGNQQSSTILSSVFIVQRSHLGDSFWILDPSFDIVDELSSKLMGFKLVDQVLVGKVPGRSLPHHQEESFHALPYLGKHYLSIWKAQLQNRPLPLLQQLVVEKPQSWHPPKLQVLVQAFTVQPVVAWNPLNLLLHHKLLYQQILSKYKEDRKWGTHPQLMEWMDQLGHNLPVLLWISKTNHLLHNSLLQRQHLVPA